MHSFLRTIGFSEDSLTESALEIPLGETYRAYDQMVSVMGKNTNIAYIEAGKAFGPNFGLKVCGELDGTGFHRTNYFPYLRSNLVTSSESLQIQQSTDGSSYIGVIADGRVGFPLAFSLQNPGDYNRELRFGQPGDDFISTTLTGMCLSAAILLPLRQFNETPEEKALYYDKRINAVAEAKRGDEKAIQLVTLQDMDLYTMVSRRLQEEDLFSIIETYMIPYGLERTMYRILGRIENVHYYRNSYTDEFVCVMTLQCNGMVFDTAINRKDIIGEPKIGRRFKGNIWMQGKMNFRQKSETGKV